MPLTISTLLIEGETIGSDESYFKHIFQLLAESGDPLRIFVARRVCKAWKSEVDTKLREQDWCDLCFVFSVDEQLRRYCYRQYDLSGSFLSEGASPREAYKKAALGHCDTFNPALKMILDGLVRLGVEQACSGEAGSFPSAFNCDMRGWTYYAMYMTTRQSRKYHSHEFHRAQLRTWWPKALADMLAQVEQNMAGRPEHMRQRARDCMRTFVDKMGSVTFRALQNCRGENEDGEALHRKGHEMLSEWGW